MLLYSTRTAVFKNGDKSTLLCRITLPTGAEDESLSAEVSKLYKEIYSATYSAAKEYAVRISPPGGRLFTLTVTSSEKIKKSTLILKRTYKITSTDGTVVERAFVDRFKAKYDKTNNFTIKEHEKYKK